MGDNKQQVNKDSVFKYDDNLYDKDINPIPEPEKQLNIDNSDKFVETILEAGSHSLLDLSKIQSFTQVSQQRNTLYKLLDEMASDPRIAIALRLYTEDSTAPNPEGDIIWAVSEDRDISRDVNYILKSIEANKHAASWVHSLALYGDAYFRLYKKSEIENTYDKLLKHLTNGDEEVKKETLNEGVKEKKAPLKEDVKIKLYSKGDIYANYLEIVPNPAEMYELTQFGKTAGYIKADTLTVVEDKSRNNAIFTHYKHVLGNRDVEITKPTNFVHACLDDDISRAPETVDLFNIEKGKDGKDIENLDCSFTVRRGKSLLYDAFKAWRELMLLQNALLLNRLTKSAVTRLVQVEIGQISKEQATILMSNVKSMFEQKSSLAVGQGIMEYTNPGPMENCVFIPTRDGKGQITQEAIGGDVNVKDIVDIEYFEDLLWAVLAIPKQFVNRVNDNAGFSGGETLSIISSRYANTIKRIQTAIIQALTDFINTLFMERGRKKWCGKFTLKMQEPITQADVDKKDIMQGEIDNIRSIMDLVNDLPELPKIKILASLLNKTLGRPEISDILQEVIDDMEKGLEPAQEGGNPEGIEPDNHPAGISGIKGGVNKEFDMDSELGKEDVPGVEDEEDRLPTPAELNAGDMTQMNDEEEEVPEEQ